MVPARSVIALWSKSTQQATVLEYKNVAKSRAGVQPARYPVIFDTQVEYRNGGKLVVFTFCIPKTAFMVYSGERGFIFAYGPPARSATTLAMHLGTDSGMVNLSE